jgi:sugar O-acyltransferase (sialic acid O-acetyltransferase NeuD family)
MKPLVIFGTGAFAEIAHYYFTRDSGYSVQAFTIDAAYLAEATFLGLPVVAFEDVRTAFPPEQNTMFVAMGVQKVNRQRANKVAEAEALGYKLAGYLSSKANVTGDLIVNPNTFIMEEVCMLPGVVVGRNSILWPRTGIGFRSRIGDHCWLVASVLGESVVVGDYTFIGLNATIVSSRFIGQSNVIGAGALVTTNTKDSSVLKGAASRPSRVPSHRLHRI